MGRKRKDHTADPISIRMVELYKAGMTLAQIGEIYGVTRERARQRISKFGLTRIDSGRTKSIEQKRAARSIAINARADARCLRTYGCTYSALESLLGEKVCITKNKATAAYRHQKNNADKRGIEFPITFPQWWGVWQKSGKWDERGRGQYVMARNGDVGSYSVGNVYICTQSQNSKDSYNKTPGIVRAAKAEIRKPKLGRGKGWSYDERNKSNPYFVSVGKSYVGCYATEEEARAAYLAACAERRKKLLAVLEAA
jgi:hypothetical protein